MNRLGKFTLVMFVGAVGALALSGCSAVQEGPDMLLYEVSASEPGGEIVYVDTAGPAESISITEDMTESFWGYAPELNLTTTTPRVTVTPPDGATATCRILQVQGTSVSMLAERTGQVDAEVECVAPNLDD